MKILITGSEGFIGCHLAAQLTSRGHLVHGLDNGAAMVPDWLRRERSEWSAIDTLRCDIRDRDALAKAVSRVAPEVVVHLAARPGVAAAEDNPRVYDEVNVDGVLNVIHACRAAKVRRIVHASSSSVYGSIDGPVHEEMQLKPLGHYGRTKLMGERLIEAAAATGDISALVIRPFSVIGPRGRPDMAPWRFAECLLKGEAVTIHEGAGRDFTSVTDAAAAFALAAEDDFRGYCAVNIGGGSPSLAVDLANELARGLGSECVAKIVPHPPYMPLSTHADISRAAKLLGWAPRKSFEGSVSEFSRWFLEAKAKR